MIKTKTIKTPLMLSEAYGLTSCSSVIVPERKRSHNPEVQYGFVPKLSHHDWKNHRPSDSKNDIRNAQPFLVERSGTVFFL